QSFTPMPFHSMHRTESRGLRLEIGPFPELINSRPECHSRSDRTLTMPELDPEVEISSGTSAVIRMVARQISSQTWVPPSIAKMHSQRRRSERLQPAIHEMHSEILDFGSGIWRFTRPFPFPSTKDRESNFVPKHSTCLTIRTGAA